MKRILLLSMMLPMLTYAQKIAVIDPELKKPITYISTLKMAHLLQGSFVMETANFSPVRQSILEFRTLIEGKKDIPENMKSVIRGTTYFTASGSNGNYSIVLDTKIDKMGSYYVLVDKSESRKKNLESIDEFLAYLERKK